jgi:hypothetical protein
MAQNELSRGGAIALGLALGLTGLCFLGLGVEGMLREREPLASDHALGIPLGLIFVFSGALLLWPQSPERPRHALGALVVTSFALAFDWIAFGPGRRSFSAGGSAGGLGATAGAGETVGRVAFGVGAILFDACAAVLWWRLLRPRRKGLHGSRS